VNEGSPARFHQPFNHLRVLTVPNFKSSFLKTMFSDPEKKGIIIKTLVATPLINADKSLSRIDTMHPQQFDQETRTLPRQTYQTATPLSGLGRVPAPVDCPVCGQRSMTRISYKIGNINQ